MCYPRDEFMIGGRPADAPWSESERAELVQLRSENAELRMQRDVFKRPTALWVAEAMGRNG